MLTSSVLRDSQMASPRYSGVREGWMHEGVCVLANAKFLIICQRNGGAQVARLKEAVKTEKILERRNHRQTGLRERDPREEPSWPIPCYSLGLQHRGQYSRPSREVQGGGTEEYASNQSSVAADRPCTLQLPSGSHISPGPSSTLHNQTVSLRWTLAAGSHKRAVCTPSVRRPGAGGQ